MASTEGEEYMSATVSVPKYRFAEFHSMFGRWLAEAPAATDGSATSMGGGLSAWKEGDIAEARTFLGSISEKASAIISLWLDSPKGEWVSAEASAAAAGLDGAYGVAGSLSSVGRAMKKVGRERPFEHRAGEVAAYRISEPVRTLFRKARAEMWG